MSGTVEPRKIKKRSNLLARSSAASGSTSRTSQRQLPSEHSLSSQPRSNVRLTAAETALHEERVREKAEKEKERTRKRREGRLEELERGVSTKGPGGAGAGGSSGAGMDGGLSSGLGLPPASTSAATLAGILAGRQAQEEHVMDDLSSVNSPKGSLTDGNFPRRKQSADLRRILTHRKGLRALLEDASSSQLYTKAQNNFQKSVAVRSKYPAHRSNAPPCSICGYWGDIRCMRCGERLCSRRCIATHDETRCERPL